MILLFEDNLMWSARLQKTLNAFGRANRVVTAAPDDLQGVEAAIVNLGSERFRKLVPSLTAAGVPVIGHAGHKEKDLLELGREAGCQVLATNSELTFKLEAVLDKALSA